MTSAGGARDCGGCCSVLLPGRVSSNQSGSVIQLGPARVANSNAVTENYAMSTRLFHPLLDAEWLLLHSCPCRLPQTTPGFSHLSLDNSGQSSRNDQASRAGNVMSGTTAAASRTLGSAFCSHKLPPLCCPVLCNFRLP